MSEQQQQRDRMSDYDIDKIAERLTQSEWLRFELQAYFRYRAKALAPLCESPIELKLLTAIDFNMNLVADTVITFRIGQAGSDPLIGLAEPCLVIVPQYPWRDFRIDFAVFAAPGRHAQVFIECDGHAFHERTPQQAEYDRRRDRLVQEAGIPILRFTGREIYRDPFDCAAQVVNFIW